MTNKIFKTTEDAARTAGLIDGDGSLIVQIKRNEARGYNMGHQIQLTLQVTQSSIRRSLLEEIKDEIGDGNIRDRPVSKLGSKVSDYYTTKRELIYKILEEIYPYLRKDVKKRQAKLMMVLIVLMRDPLYSSDPVKFLAICDIADQISSLNDTKKRSNNAETIRIYLREVKGLNV